MSFFFSAEGLTVYLGRYSSVIAGGVIVLADQTSSFSCVGLLLWDTTTRDKSALEHRGGFRTVCCQRGLSL